MARTALISHPACLAHDPGPHHPESINRLRVVMAALDRPEFAGLLREEAPRATTAQLLRAHTAAYVEEMLTLDPAPGELVALDPDTIASPGTLEAALRAAGGSIHAVDAVMAGRVRNAFVATRPPGHHAERARAMGFCLFASAAIAARHAQARWGLARVAVVDFDVHHGNGTQDIAWDDAGMFYGSSHQSPCYPGTGLASEHGGHHQIVNAPLPPGAGGPAFRAVWRDRIIPALDAYAPELIIVSAGFDAHRADPLAQLMVEDADFDWLTRALLAAADRHCAGRLVSILEGGYDLAALAASTALHVSVLLHE